MGIVPGWRYGSYPPPRNGIRGQIEIAAFQRFGRWGFAYAPNTLVSPSPPAPAYYSSHRVYFPHGFAAAVLAIPPALVTWRRVRNRRLRRSGLCPRCGYD